MAEAGMEEMMVVVATEREVRELEEMVVEVVREVEGERTWLTFFPDGSRVSDPMDLRLGPATSAAARATTTSTARKGSGAKRASEDDALQYEMDDEEMHGLMEAIDKSRAP